MKTTKLSLIALMALGTLSSVYAEEVAKPAQEGEAQVEQTQTSVQAKKSTTLGDIFAGTTIKGYAYERLTSMFGDDASGTALRTRIFANIETGAYQGFSVGTTLWASIGGSAPNGGTFLENSTKGKDVNNSVPLSIYGIYAKQTFQSTKTTITGGQVTIDTPFNDSAWDYGLGVAVNNTDINGIRFSAQAYGAWGLDVSNELSKSAAGHYSFDSDRPLMIAGVSGDAAALSGVGFKLWAANSIKTVDYLVFGELGYTTSGVTIQGQVAATQVNTQSTFFNNDILLKNKTNIAKTRGLYNVQVAYSGSGLGASVGYTGSFGEGYGALLNNGSFNMGGKFWYDTVGDKNGYTLGGNGGVKNTSIQVVYAQLTYKLGGVGLGLDYAYVSGNNHYSLMKKGIANHKNANGQSITNMNATLHELTASASYAFSDKLKLTALVGSTFGDLTQGRARAELKYTF
ncbi:hypothetical protein BBW65_05110 [Helicobacter enhydrae]|uniref:Major outer membrane protein n=1 Tax=Helicobacter enhydrae TaxID=222136 RepID=A0A1B1U636_9HELI|nr:major outer membrane protein [Helicobacter enhydrae]ANV98216.1 hypothetical protein BBW65_05110 [Helicobacter enhydrae]